MQKEGISSIKSLIAGAWEATADNRIRLFTVILLFTTAYTLDLLAPWAIGYTLGLVVEKGLDQEGFNQALYGVAAYVLIRLFHNLCHHVARYLQQTVSYRAKIKTLEQIFAIILKFPLSWHINHHSGENLSRLHRSAGAIDMAIGSYLWQIIDGVIKILFASVALFALDFFVALNVSLMGVATILIMIFFNRRMVERIRANNSFMDRMNRICVDYLFNIITVKSLFLEKRAEQYLLDRRSEGEKLNRRFLRLSELKWSAVSIGYTVVIGTSLVIYLYGHRGIGTALDVAQIYVLLNYLDRIFQAIGSFTGYFSGIIESSTAYEDATRITSESKLVKAQVETRLPHAWRDVSIKDLNFLYTIGQPQGLSGINLEIKRGERIALVGPSGSGKSTLLKILAGLLVAESANIIVDGSEISKLDQISNSSLFLPQEPEVFSESVSYNLTLGDKFSNQELAFIISLCKLDEVIAKLPEGWDSFLAESGMNLSVGEKQRFSIARGLLRAKTRDILLLDEPTSSLDPATEKQIFYGLLHHFSDRTIISACHHLALIPLFNKIIYVKQHKIEEAGTFDELIGKNGLFAKAWRDFSR
jgi:ABC-type multidrug transport system fused ATPase/permease subunit